MNYRKFVRDSLVEVLAAEDTGFNAQLAALEGYDVTPFSIEWTVGSPNFLISYIDPDAVKMSSIRTYPAAVLYTSTGVNDKLVKGRRFSGQVTAHLDFYLIYRALKEEDALQDSQITEAQSAHDTESIADAVEDAITTVLEASRGSLQTKGPRLMSYRVDRDAVANYGDGPGQRVAVTLTFNLEVS